MDSPRKTALVAGVLYLLTFVSIPTLALYGPVRGRNYVTGDGPDTAAVVGGALEVVVAFACVGTAVTLFPILKRQNESVALGFVGARTLEGAAIIAGVACLLTVVTLRRTGAGADAVVSGQVLVALYDRLFLLGQSLMPAVNALLLGSLLYRSRLVPRALPVLGFVGAPLLLAATLATMAGAVERDAPVVALAALPIALWELSLGIWLIARGFRPSPLTSADRAADPAA
ncbi:DUF4386 domain-containing protein [Amycolatopsis sp. NBC_00355]|uniref:DUF4386 domain-containing protein n=1 Tax=Amycolatopsis sp. NBC_00355 TaxID=2975957 RepID=UPI002E270278